MFEIGQKVVSKNSGVCIINHKELKNFGIGEQEYLVLEPYFKTGTGTSKIYIPEAKAEEQLRGLLDKNEVMTIIKKMGMIEKIWYTDPKIRRQKFEEIYRTGDVLSICQLIKSLYAQSEIMKQQKKTLSMVDREFLDKFVKDIHEEFAIVLDKDVRDIPKFIISYAEGTENNK